MTLQKTHSDAKRKFLFFILFGTYRHKHYVYSSSFLQRFMLRVINAMFLSHSHTLFSLHFSTNLISKYPVVAVYSSWMLIFIFFYLVKCIIIYSHIMFHENSTQKSLKNLILIRSHFFNILRVCSVCCMFLLDIYRYQVAVNSLFFSF